MLPNTPEGIITAIFILNILISFAVVFLERKSPSATLAWLMVLSLMPGVGIFLYLMLSQNFTRRKVFKLTQGEINKHRVELTGQMDDMEFGHYRHVNPSGEKWKDLIYLCQRHGYAYYSQNNSVEVITDGKKKFEKLCKDLESAEKSINMEYFILKPDATGLKVLKILENKAKEGVEVRLLLDAAGSISLKKKHIKPLLAAGGKAEFFFPPSRFFRFQLKLNYRNHRKLVIIDDKTAYIGGHNVAEEYQGRSAKFGGWRDTHLRITGGAVEDIDARFLLDWRSASGEVIEASEKNYDVSREDGKAGIQIISSGPDSPEEEIKRVYLKIIANAKKNVYIQTPYFIPDQSIYEALKIAALSGRDVRLMIPCKPDHPFVYWVTYYNAAWLMKAGVKVYIYNNGFLHSKTITADDEVCSVGSANFDVRSFKLNFESNAIIYDGHTASELKQAFIKDIDSSTKLTPAIYAQRGILIKFKEGVGRLISDIL
ncbi:MAG: cardiolipin synthase [Clostridia bacterium]|nr:cardiolipin synthase [Clostridia bacterium]